MNGLKSMTIGFGGAEAEVLNFGASIADLRIPVEGSRRSVVLSLADRANYPRHGAYFGSIAGRCANRIGGGRATISGREYRLSLNEKGKTHLHGGFNGFSSRYWNFESTGNDRVRLSLTSPDGEEGYPGTMQASCEYRFLSEGVLRIELAATVDAPSIANFATHSYFNLGREPHILNHELEIPAFGYTPVDGDLIPTGELADVGGTGFDFREFRRIAANRPLTPTGFDINYAAYPKRAEELRALARLRSPEGDLSLAIWSTEPGLQFYDGQYLPLPVEIMDGRNVRFGGCCLEPQCYPDAVNHRQFPGVALLPGERYLQRTEYRFSAG